MTIRFAAAIRGENRVVARILGASMPLEAGNDNFNGIASDKLIRATLRHFARYGLGAARQAKDNAELAWLSEDFEGYEFWLSVCRMLDRRMADSFSAEHLLALCAPGASGPEPFGNRA